MTITASSPRSGVALHATLEERPIVKEMTTKLAWSIGSTLHLTYGQRTALREWCEELAVKVYNNWRAR